MGFDAQLSLLKILLVELPRNHMHFYMSSWTLTDVNRQLYLVIDRNIFSCFSMTRWSTVTLYWYVEIPISIKNFLSYWKMGQLPFPQFALINAPNILEKHSSHFACRTTFVKNFHQLQHPRNRPGWTSKSDTVGKVRPTLLKSMLLRLSSSSLLLGPAFSTIDHPTSIMIIDHH